MCVDKTLLNETKEKLENDCGETDRSMGKAYFINDVEIFRRVI